MITCTFIGSEQYDLDLYEKIQAAVKKVVERGDEIEFLFYRQEERFHHLCFWAVLRARQRFPDKRITMTLYTLLSAAGDLAAAFRRYKLPEWAFDRIITVPLSPAEEGPSACPWKKLERNMARRSDCAIACCYPSLRGPEWEVYRYAAALGHVEVFNLISKETAGQIAESIKKLPPEERTIVEHSNGGQSYAALARDRGLSPACVRARDRRGRSRLRGQALEALERARLMCGPTPGATCCVILVGHPGNTDGVRARFRFAADLLIEDMGVSNFLLEQANCPCRAFGDLWRERPDLKTVVVTHASVQAGDALRERYIPPFTGLISIDPGVKPSWAKYLRGVKEMLARSEYVVCDLTDIDSRILRAIRRRKGLTVIDLGKTPHCLPPPC